MKVFRYSFSLLAFLFLLHQQSFTQRSLNIVREELTIPLTDGIELGAILYGPKEHGKYPAIVYRTPYSIDDYDSYAELPRKAAHEGYLVFLVDVRGRYRSGGDFEAYRHEKKDGYDVLEWVANHPRCNGKVGTYGGSYPGIVQWQAMSLSPPHLVAAAPEMTPISSHHFFYYGGAFSMPWLDWFVPYIFPDKRKKAGDITGTWDDEEGANQWLAGDRRFWYQYRPLSEMPILKKHAPEYFEWLRHPDLSEWWDFVNMEEGFADFVVPVFLLSGWYDSAYGIEGAWRAYDKIQGEPVAGVVKDHSKLILGPWNHTSITTRKTVFGSTDFGPTAGLDYDALLLDWFDGLLKDKADRLDLAPVNIFVMGSNEWRAFEHWPIEPVEEHTWHLNQYASLNPVVSPQNSALQYVFDPADPLWDKAYEKSYPYDQSENESRNDVLVFTSDVLAEDTEVIGEIKAHLFVSSTAPDTDFAITLCDVFPDGSSVNVTTLDAGYLRMRYREGYENQKLMVPGEIYEIVIDNMYTANVFRKGHKIRLSITSAKAPHYDPNPNTGKDIASATELKKCTNSVFFGQQTPSRLVLPLYQSKED